MKELAIGFFDGVHLGHQAILRGASAALTFANHPLAVLAPEKAPRLIMSVDDRVAAIQACGVGEVRVLPFDRRLAALPPESFLRDYIGAGCAVRCGANWRFGAGGAGDAAFLRAHGVAVEVVPFAAYEGARISSSRIRAALERGEVEAANAMLGRRFVVHGTREEGKGLGRRLGFPTLNLSPEGLALRLPHGVYAVEVGGARGVANYGLAPTLGDAAWREPVFEVHFRDGDASAGGGQAAVSVELLRFLRPECAFASLEDLQRQIKADCQEAFT